MNLCAVIPAAGRGTQLGADRPKLLVEVAPGLSIWSVLSGNVRTVADHVNVIVSPDGRQAFEAALGPGRATNVSISVQAKPIGMGDAIFCGQDVWSKAESILVIWGDQVHVSRATLARAAAAHRAIEGPRITLPVARMARPYVEYVFNDEDGGLVRVLQKSRGRRMPTRWLGRRRNIPPVHRRTAGRLAGVPALGAGGRIDRRDQLLAVRRLPIQGQAVAGCSGRSGKSGRSARRQHARRPDVLPSALQTARPRRRSALGQRNSTHGAHRTCDRGSRVHRQPPD